MNTRLPGEDMYDFNGAAVRAEWRTRLADAERERLARQLGRAARLARRAAKLQRRAERATSRARLALARAL